MKLVVLGGNGFLGSHICRSGVIRGWKVTSLSRSGSPKLEGIIPEWATKVNWCRGDLLDGESYRPHVLQADAVIHSVGALMSADYKPIVNKSFCEAALGILSTASNNPLKKTNDVYKINYETAKILKIIAKDLKTLKTLGYVSATPVLPSLLFGAEYIASKRAAEQVLLTSPSAEKVCSTLIFRPGLMYSENRPIASNLANAMNLINTTGDLLTTPLRVELVAEAIVQAIEASQKNLHFSNQIYGVSDLQALVR